MNKLFANIDKKQIVRYAVLALIVALTAVLQSVIGLGSISNLRLYVMVSVIVAIGMLEEETAATLFGIFGGLCLDVFSSVHMGYNAVILGIIGLFTSLVVSHFLRSTILTNILFSGIALAGYSVLYWLFFIVFGQIEGGFKTIFSIYLPNSFVTWLLSPVIYIIIRVIRKFLVEKSNRITL